MIGLALIYFLGKKFYELAEEHQKSKWLWAILGVIFYYFGTFAFGIALGIIQEINGSTPFDNTNEFLLGIIALPFGLLIWWLGLNFFKKRWNKESCITESDLLDDNHIK